MIKLLDALEPRGKVVAPFAKLEDSDKPLHQQMADWFKTPESAATYAATLILDDLFRPKKMTAEERAVFKQVDEDPPGIDMVAHFERQYFAMDTVGRILGVDQTHLTGVFPASRKEPKP